MNSLDSNTSSFSMTSAGSIRNLSSSKHPSILVGSPEATAKLLPIIHAHTHTHKNRREVLFQIRPSSHYFADAKQNRSKKHHETAYAMAQFSISGLVSLHGRRCAAWDIPDGIRTVPDALSLPR